MSLLPADAVSTPLAPSADERLREVLTVGADVTLLLKKTYNRGVKPGLQSLHSLSKWAHDKINPDSKLLSFDTVSFTDQLSGNGKPATADYVSNEGKRSVVTMHKDDKGSFYVNFYEEVPGTEKYKLVDTKRDLNLYLAYSYIVQVRNFRPR